MESSSDLGVLRESSTSYDKENVSSDEPPVKKVKTDKDNDLKNKLEDRLCGILCCAVCLDLPKTCYQVSCFQDEGQFSCPIQFAFVYDVALL